MTQRGKERLWTALLLAGVVVAFFRAVAADYVVWDDQAFIQGNPLLRDDFLPAVKAAFTQFFMGDYLPLTLMSYWFEIQVFGFDPGSQHAVNLALHLVNVLLLLRVLRARAVAPRVAWLVAVIFALHPLQVEPVMWISDRKSLLATAFLLASALAWLRRGDSSHPRVLYAAYVGFFVLSLLCKATGLLLPVVLVVGDLAYGKAGWKAALRCHLPTLLIVAPWTALRFYAYGGAIGGAFDALADPTRLSTLLPQVGNALGFYVQKSLVPVDLCIVYPGFALDGVTWARTAGFAALCVAWVFAWRRSRDPAWIFFGATFLAFLVPVLPFAPRVNYLNDRYMYVPLIGLAGLVALAVSELLGSRRPAGVVMASLTVAAAITLGVVSGARSEVWLTNQALWTDVISKQPLSAQGYNGLADDYLRHRPLMATDADAAIGLFGKGAARGALDGNAIQSYLGLSWIYSDVDQYRDLARAESYLQEGLRRFPTAYEAPLLRLMLGRVQTRATHYAEAGQTLVSLLKDLEGDPDVVRKTILAAVGGALQDLKDAWSKVDPDRFTPPLKVVVVDEDGNPIGGRELLPADFKIDLADPRLQRPEGTTGGEAP